MQRSIASALSCVAATTYALTLQAATVYWADFGAERIQGYDTANTTLANIVTAADMPTGVFRVREVAVSSSLNRLYWTNPDNHSIQWSNLDGSAIHTKLDSQVNEGGIVVDDDHGTFYWSDNSSDRIFRMNLDGSGRMEFPTLVRIEQPQALALDLTNHKLYWADFQGGEFPSHIARSNLDGSSAEIVVSFSGGANNALPSGIAIDPAGGKIYWSDVRNVGSIHRMNLDGTGDETIISGLGDPNRLVLDLSAGKLYWTEAGLGLHKVQRANLDGTNVEDVAIGLQFPNGIAILPIPEPSSIALASAGIIALALVARRRR